ncbi:MAG: ribonuclease III, partial [Bacillota bacterium]
SKDIEKIEKIIGYEFVNKQILKQAFTHTSFANENNTLSYERLEFLGDAALGFIVATELYKRYPGLNEGKLTKLRAHLVSCGNLSKAIKKTELMDYMLVGAGDIKSNMLLSNHMKCDLFEAIAGAIFIDSNFDIALCKKFILKFLDSDIIKAETKESYKDHKSLLLEICAQKGQKVCFEFANEKKKPEEDFIFEILIDSKKVSKGQGRTKKEAQKKAAKNYFDSINKNS